MMLRPGTAPTHLSPRMCALFESSAGDFFAWKKIFLQRVRLSGRSSATVSQHPGRLEQRQTDERENKKKGAHQAWQDAEEAHQQEQVRQQGKSQPGLPTPKPVQRPEHQDSVVVGPLPALSE